MRIGTAGWSIPAAERAAFPAEGSQLQRYSARLCCVEIDTSFYRPHRPQTYARWAASVPAGFRFAVKAPRAITHEARLRGVRAKLQAFLEEISALGAALGPVLLQLPASLAFDPALAGTFFAEFRTLFAGEAVLEPRHASWFGEAAEAGLRAYAIARAGVDPAPVTAAAQPADAPAPRYWRLHGSPRMYYSEYGETRLRGYAQRLASDDWVILDNTANGHAISDALTLQRLLEDQSALAVEGAKRS